ncbi:MAG: GspH/FimT family pseudopilin [Marinobacter sp.]|uniref:GspH/FimT family pseudopilin n=1 Tax=Marinobacter sp. TaxID=50741 RepID=UPI003C417FD4
MQNNRHNQRGLTLLELLITTGILMITITLTLPSLTSVVGNNQLNATTDTLRKAITLVRAESIKRGHRVVGCLSDKPDACNSSRPLQLLVFSDRDRTGDPTTTGDLIKIVELDYPTITTSYNRSYLAFSPLGYASGTNGTFKVCHRNGQGELLVISTLGRIRKAVDYDGDGLVEKTPGTPITC